MSRSANLKRIISEDVDNAGAALAKAHIKCMDFPEEGDLAEVHTKAIAINAQHYYLIQMKRSQHELAQIDPMSATLAALRPGCIGDGTVDFTRWIILLFSTSLKPFSRFGEILCGCRELCDQLRRRFKEFLITGMCVFCQVAVK